MLDLLRILLQYVKAPEDVPFPFGKDAQEEFQSRNAAAIDYTCIDRGRTHSRKFVEPPEQCHVATLE